MKESSQRESHEIIEFRTGGIEPISMYLNNTLETFVHNYNFLEILRDIHFI